MEPRKLPSDFGRRVRAAVAYRGVSLEAFAAEIDTAGMSLSTIRKWIEQGHIPPPLTQDAVVRRLAAASGLSEDFFYGQAPDVSLKRMVEEMTSRIRLLVTLLENRETTETLQALREFQNIARDEQTDQPPAPPQSTEDRSNPSPRAGRGDSDPSAGTRDGERPGRSGMPIRHLGLE